MANLIPYTKSSITKPQKSAIIKADKFLNAKSSKTNVNSVKPKQSKNSSEDILLKIEKKVIKIDKLLKDSFALKKKQQKKVRIKGEQKEFEDREKELEKKKPKKEKGVNLPTPPKMGFIDWIKNFVFNTILGFLAVRLLKFLPTLLKIYPVIIGAGEFLINVGGNLLNSLVSFVDWGYKAVDATSGFIKSIGGEGLSKIFDNFVGAIDNVLEFAVMAALVSSGGDDESGGLGGKGGRRGYDSQGRRVGKNVQQRYARRFGKDQFVDRFGTKNLKNVAQGARRGVLQQGARNAFVGVAGKGGAKSILKFVRPLTNKLPIIGGLLNFGLSVALGEDPGRAAFKAIGSTLVGALGAAIGSLAFGVGGIIGGIIGGIGGDALGGALYDMFFKGKKPTQKQGKTNKLAGGGSPIPSTRGGKSVSSAPTRTLKKKKKSTRSLSIIPSKIKPGKSAGGEDKVQSVFPNPEKNWWDPFGVFSGKPQQQQQKKPTEKVSNPQEFLLESNDVLGKSNFFGPFFTLALKSVLGDKPNKLDYLKVGQGLNSWMQGVFKTGPLGFAGGGEVDAKQFFSGEDYTQVIAKSVEDSVSKEIDTTIRNLKDELSLKRPVGRDEMLQENIRRGTEEGEFESGPAGTSGDKLTMARNLMRDLGLTSAQAAGIVGNMAAESGVENARPQGSRPGTKAPLKVDGVTGYGLVQWTSKGRQQALADFARSRGADLSKPLSMDIEYQFFLKEFKGAYGNVLKQIKNATDTKTSSTIFMQQYEIPAGYKTEAKIMERYNMSKPIYDKLARGEGKATKGPGTFISPPTGKEYGSGTGGTYGKSERGTKISGDLGKYIKQNLNSPKDFSQVSEHPNYGGSFRRSYKSWHNVDRAIDIGGFWPQDQKKILPKIEEFNKKNNVKPVELLYGKPGTPSSNSHGDHVHVAYAKGGETLDGPHQALIGEKGTEYVIDADSYRATEKVAPGLFDILNYDVKDKASLIKYLPNIISSLSQYTDYENPNQEPQIVYIEVPVEVPFPIGSDSPNILFASGEVNRDKDNNMKATLAQIG